MAGDRTLAEPGTDAVSRRGAALVSDTLGPLPPLAALCGAGAASSSSVIRGIGWGLLAMFFVAIFPYLVTWRIRHPAGGGRPAPRVRASYMGLAVVTAAVGFAVLNWLGSPAPVLSVVVAVLVGLAVAAVTNARWGWSNHMAACSAGVAMLIVLFGASGVWAVLALPAVAWARLTLGRHVPSELILGGVGGAAVSASVLAALL